MSGYDPDAILADLNAHLGDWGRDPDTGHAQRKAAAE